MHWKYLFILISFPILASGQVIRKSKVSFPTSDNLIVTADHYISKKSNPYIILLHTEGSSRAEYDFIATRLLKLNYNCLAVDLRSGDRYEFTTNETAKRAKEMGLANGLYESAKDVKASIDYVKSLSDSSIILFGSSFSATLSIILAENDSLIDAVIAFSPGNFFSPESDLKEIIPDYKKPLFAGFSVDEFPFVEEIFAETELNNLTVFKPINSNGIRTTKALLNSNAGSDEYWFALLVFFRNIR
jgi:dienelactone hydrolase